MNSRDRSFFVSGAVAVYVAILGLRVLAVTVERTKFEELWGDDYVVTSVSGPDTNELRNLAYTASSNVVDETVADWARKGSPAPATDLTPAFEYTRAVSNMLENSKQDKLISGLTVKTINQQSILGPGNIDIQGGGVVIPEKFATGNLTNADGAAVVDLKTTGKRLGFDWCQTSQRSEQFYEFALLSNVTVAAGSTIVYSIDGGLNWRPSSGFQGSMINCLEVSGTRIFAGDVYSGLYLSDDFGKTWVKTSVTDTAVSGIAADGNSVVCMTPENIWYSRDNGDTWTKCENTGGIPTYSSHHVAVGKGLFVAGSTDGHGLFYSEDGGATWQQSSKSDETFYKVFYGNGVFLTSGMTSTYEHTGIWYSDDGKIWTKSSGAYYGNVSDFGFGRTNIVATFNDSYSIPSYSDDGGRTWNRIKPDYSCSDGCIAYNHGVFFAVPRNGSATALISMDDGLTWKRQSIPFKSLIGLSSCGNSFFSSSYHTASGSTLDGILMSDGSFEVPVVQNIRVDGFVMHPDANNCIDITLPSDYVTQDDVIDLADRAIDDRLDWDFESDDGIAPALAVGQAISDTKVILHNEIVSMSSYSTTSVVGRTTIVPERNSAYDISLNANMQILCPTNELISGKVFDCMLRIDNSTENSWVVYLSGFENLEIITSDAMVTKTSVQIQGGDTVYLGLSKIGTAWLMTYNKVVK